MKIHNTKIALRQSGVEGAPGRRIEGIFEVVLDLDAIQDQMRRAAGNKSRESSDGAVTVIFTPTSRAAADEYVNGGKLTL